MYKIKSVELYNDEVRIKDYLVFDNLIDGISNIRVLRYQDFRILGFNCGINMYAITSWHFDNFLDNFSDNVNHYILTLIQSKNDSSKYEGTFVFLNDKTTNDTEVKVKISGYTIFKNNTKYVSVLTDKSDKFCFSLNGITYTISNTME